MVTGTSSYHVGVRSVARAISFPSKMCVSLCDVTRASKSNHHHPKVPIPDVFGAQGPHGTAVTGDAGSSTGRTYAEMVSSV